MPATVRAIYLPSRMATSETLPAQLELVRRTGVDALVVDVKDAEGYVSLPYEIDLPMHAPRHDASGLLDLRTLIEAARGPQPLWLIARVVVFDDPCLIRDRPEWAVQRADGTPYSTGNQTSCGPSGFISPYVPEAWDYAAAVARAAIDVGFDEVQLDYVRFPDEPVGTLAFPGQGDDTRPRTDVIADGVASIREALPEGAVLSADVFGRVVRQPDETIGQDIVKIGAHADYVSPMVYPSLWGPGDFGIPNPEADPRALVDRSLAAYEQLVAREAHKPQIRLWLQSGEWWGEPTYGRAEIHGQIQGALDHGRVDWMLWQPDGVYTDEQLEGFPR